MDSREGAGDMNVTERLDQQLQNRLVAKGYRRRGRRFVGNALVVEMLPAGEEDRVTVFVGRCATPGDPSRLADCSRVTMARPAELDRFLTRV